jgi:membrane protease YdiL (CAAX protease family)
MTTELYSLAAFALLSFFFLYLGWKRGFFALPASTGWFFPIRYYHVIGIFFLYFFIVIVGVHCLSILLKKGGIFLHSISGAVWLNFLSSCLILGAIALYLWFLRKKITPNILGPNIRKTFFSDIQFGTIAWILSFPLVIFCNQFFDFVLHEFFHVSLIPEQLAVRFLKMTFDTPLHLTLTSITIVFFAPLIEETLFRGFLQSFIRQHLGVNHSIVITALCFSCFHYSPEQGIGNLSIIGSLFFLALFLGYTYDRRRSLIAPITLHTLFNAVNVINLYFFGGFPKGPCI